MCPNDAEKKSVGNRGYSPLLLLCYNHYMKKDLNSYLKTFKNIYECPNCGKEVNVRYGVMKCENCGKEYFVKRKFISVVVIVFMFLGLSELFWNGNYFEGDAMLNSLALVGLLLIGNFVVGYLLFRFVPGGVMEYEEVTDKDR